MKAFCLLDLQVISLPLDFPCEGAERLNGRGRTMAMDFCHSPLDARNLSNRLQCHMVCVCVRRQKNSSEPLEIHLKGEAVQRCDLGAAGALCNPELPCCEYCIHVTLRYTHVCALSFLHWLHRSRDGNTFL